MSSPQPYQVLARKYRPQNFDDLIGQEVLVTTLSNAIRQQRIAHAFMLTGIRGIGKTTSARIIAKALNCTGIDGKSESTIRPCGTCDNCTAITHDRHPDVLEVDAASKTGVDDIRELIDNVHYTPALARYKIYIIDEVHMLSKSAFNALLKTLEEPPAHVKFIFATTEIRKVPVTILSRCQRFDLRRIDTALLTQHLKKIAAQESVNVEDEALLLLAKAAEGSVRDGLSLLDQAIALSGGEVKTEQVRGMLGAADKQHILLLFKQLMEGNAPETLATLKEIYATTTDAIIIFQDLLEWAHLLTRIKAAPEALNPQDIPEAEREEAKAQAEKLSFAHLGRAWQMLLKGLQEVRIAPDPYMAAEMIMLRLIHASTLPVPAEIIQQLEGATASPPAAPPASPPPAPVSNNVPNLPPKFSLSSRSEPAARHTAAQPAREPVFEQETGLLENPKDFQALTQLFRQHNELWLYNVLCTDVRVVRFESGRLELNPIAPLPNHFAGQVSKCLQEWTGKRWMLSFAKEGGSSTLQEQATAKKEKTIAQLAEHPEVKHVLDAFPGAKISDIQPVEE